MTGTYRSRAAAQSADGNAPSSEVNLACSFCATPTAQSTLSTLGARCFTCYLAFCRQQQPKVFVGDKRQDFRGWARALKAREEAGQRLDPAVQAMWRRALKHEPAISWQTDRP
jgi:hypothetical protein